MDAGPPPWGACWALSAVEIRSREGFRSCIDALAGDIQHDFGEKEIGDQHQDRRNDNGLRGGAADSLSAAAHAQPLVTADGGKDEAEDQRLSHSLHDVRE